MERRTEPSCISSKSKTLNCVVFLAKRSIPITMRRHANVLRVACVLHRVFEWRAAHRIWLFVDATQSNGTAGGPRFLNRKNLPGWPTLCGVLSSQRVGRSSQGFTCHPREGCETPHTPAAFTPTRSGRAPD